MTIFLNILFLGLGFFMLIKGADWFVDGAATIARKFGIPQIVIGLTVVAFGTSLPEAAVSITAGLQNNSEIAIGNIVGSNIVNVLLILGLCGLFAKTGLSIKKNTLWIEIPFTVCLTVLLLLLGCFDNQIGRIDGIIFIILFVLFLVYLILMTRRDRKLGLLEEENAEGQNAKEKPIWLVIILLLVGIAMIVVGSRFAVDTATTLVTMMGLSQNFAGLIIAAFGTSLPELVTSIIATKKGDVDLAIGNVVGSNIFNILFVIGITSLISPVHFASSFIIDAIIAIAAMVILFVAIVPTKKKVLGRIGGGIMFLSYIAYFIYTVITSRI